MDWLSQNWQTLAALTVVAVTLAIFVRRLARPRRKGTGCGKDCGCPATRTREDLRGSSTLRQSGSR